MNEFVTVVIKVMDGTSKEEFLKLLNDNNYEFWYIYKSDGIRLRVQKKYEREVIKLCRNDSSLQINNVDYEPELNIFGGCKTIDNVHDIFCQVNKIIYKIGTKGKIETALSLYILMEIIKMSDLDYFEEWDVWKKVSKHRRILSVQDTLTVLKHLPGIYSLMTIESNKFNNTLDADFSLFIGKIGSNIKQIKNTCRERHATRGFRGILSSVIFFVMNMLELSAGVQIGIINGLAILKNPDFRREIYYDFH